MTFLVHERLGTNGVPNHTHSASTDANMNKRDSHWLVAVLYRRYDVSYSLYSILCSITNGQRVSATVIWLLSMLYGRYGTQKNPNMS